MAVPSNNTGVNGLTNGAISRSDTTMANIANANGAAKTQNSTYSRFKSWGGVLTLNLEASLAIMVRANRV